MLLGKDSYWSDFFLSLRLPESVLGTHLSILQAIQSLYGEPTPEQELFALNYCMFYIDRNPGSIESMKMLNSSAITQWYPYFKKKSKFSVIKYRMLSFDFYRKNPLLETTKQVITAISSQIPSNDTMSYARTLALKNISNRIYLKRHLKMMITRDRFLYNILDSKREAELYLSIINAMDIL